MNKIKEPTEKEITDAIIRGITFELAILYTSRIDAYVKKIEAKK